MLHSPAEYREMWNRKPALRAVYGDIYNRMIAATVPGRIVELGGGSGNFKAFAPQTISTDIVTAPWLDAVCDAQRLPFADDSIDNVVMLDVLHHIESPVIACREAARVLKPGGRLVFCEPAMTPVSRIFFRLFHEEPFDMTVDPLVAKPITPDRNPWDSNQALADLIVGRYREAMATAVPSLKLLGVDRFSFLAYPLSGGFKPWSAIPQAMVEPLLRLEWRYRRVLGPLMAFRLLAVFEKR